MLIYTDEILARCWHELVDDSQIVKYAWNSCIYQSLRQRIKPPLGFPFACIWAPQFWIPVGRKDRDEHVSSLRNRNFVYILAIEALDWYTKRQHRVLSRSRKAG